MNLLLFNLKTDADDSVLGFTTEWINAIASNCESVTVITMMSGSIKVAQNVQVYSIGKEKGHSELRRLFTFYKILISVLRTKDIQACFAHMMPLFSVLGWPLLKWKKIPIVLWYAHGSVSWLLRLATLLVDRVVASNPSGFRIKTPKFRSIGQGINVDRFQPSSPLRASDSSKIFLTVGRISPVKNLDVAIKAFSLLPKPVLASLKLHLIGDPLGKEGELYYEELQKLVIELNLTNHIQFLPAFPFHQVDQAYRGAFAFINSSDTDSMDKTVLEAMSSGLPVITSNLAFQNEFSTSYARSWMIPKNNPEALAEKIQEMTGLNENSWREMGVELRELVIKHHSLPQLASRITREVSNCLNEK